MHISIPWCTMALKAWLAWALPENSLFRSRETIILHCDPFGPCFNWMSAV
jgi:hypothetical protein